MARTYFKLDCFGEATSPISSSTKSLKPEAFEALKSYASEVRKVLEFQPESSDTIVLAWKNLATWCDLIPTWSDVQAFVRFAKDIRVRIKNLLFRSLVESMRELYGDINTSLPKYAHFCNDEQCCKQLCTRHLLNPPGYDWVRENVPLLLEAMTDAKTLLREWPISDVDIATSKEEIQSAMNVYNAARTALAVIASAKALYVLRGKEKVDQCAALLQQSYIGFPLALATLLQEEVTSAAAALPRKRSAAAAVGDR